jgi:uncharacterized lipoprotein YmbA
VKNTITLAVLGLALAACASTPATIEYYRIDPANTGNAAAISDTAKTVVLDTVELPGFLSQAGLVMQSGDHKISISTTHLWAQRLDKALPRLLARKLQSRSTEFVFYQRDSDWVATTDYLVRVRIDNFQPTTAGEVITSGSIQLMDAISGQPSPPRDFSYSRDLRADGYAAAVVQMDELLGQIADLIIEALDD